MEFTVVFSLFYLFDWKPVDLIVFFSLTRENVSSAPNRHRACNLSRPELHFKKLSLSFSNNIKLRDMNYNDKNLCCRLVFMMICICYFCTESMTQDADQVIINLSNRSLQTYTSNTSLVIKATKAINVMESNKLHSPFFRTGIVIASPSATTAVTKTTASPSTNYTSSTTQSISSRKPSSTGETVIMVIFAVLAFTVLILVISTLTLVRSYWVLLFYLVLFEDSLQFHVIFRYILEVRVYYQNDCFVDLNCWLLFLKIFWKKDMSFIFTYTKVDNRKIRLILLD